MVVILLGCTLVGIDPLIDTRTSISTEGPWCGVHSLGIALNWLNRPEEGALELIDSSPPLSFTDLSRAAEAAGCVTTLWSFPKDVDALPCTAILHIRTDLDLVHPDHFIVYLGRVQERWLVVDFPDPPFTISREKREAIWDGTALLVENPPARSIAILRHQSRWRLGLAVVAIASFAWTALLVARKLTTVLDGRRVR
ncbi:hypothetical protein Pan216_35200 [Planctomycetes bacterium Pan216]|uniref:Peptidase C39 domain-containing protein n=1 Tax=Kolteria novifilia TaxID=2527975 RepID=A0A518B6P6_9BACT|nr:hypothetical protein Pan216_35200 [Planctomycetes bacterium Pan216]